ncbi:MAG: putative membrane protein [Neolewinella sp.]|jgi:putative membrane protein
MSYPQLKTYPDQERTLKILIWAVSAAVLLLVVAMRRYTLPVPDAWDVGFLPAVNATLNTLTAVALVFSLYFIKKKNVVAHRSANGAALGFSVLFLLCYVVYHFTTPEVKFGDIDHDGLLSVTESAAVAGTRPVYLMILLSHIALAAILLPFILLNTLRALAGKYELHRKMARVVWPLWLYVAITGPVVYLMLRVYYP